jgi:site-specific DNA recombinase
VIIDEQRAPVIKQMFEKVAYEKLSGRKIYNWLRYELNFHTRGNKPLTLAGVYRVLDQPFYYGMYEYPRKSGQWYHGKHKPIITKELFEKATAQLKRDNIVRENKEFAFTKLFTCGLCGSGISAEEKFKQRKDGTAARYVYYGCTRGKDRNCKNLYIREEELIQQLLAIIDRVSINELGMKYKLEEEIKRFNKFNHVVMGTKAEELPEEAEVNLRKYAKYLLKEGSVTEKRELLANLRSRLIYKDKTLTLVEE